jgi:maleylacetate reductase
VLLAIGGGSAVGAAKAVALTARLPIVAVPTTYAGSEVTPVWGMTEGGRKTTGTDPAVLPRVIVYDPELTASLPTSLAVTSGLNAMAHAVEAFWAPRRNPASTGVAQEAIARLATGLRTDDRAELLSPAARQHARDRAAARAGVQRARRAGRGGPGGSGTGRRPRR